jgi:hypothetical protein
MFRLTSTGLGAERLSFFRRSGVGFDRLLKTPGGFVGVGVKGGSVDSGVKGAAVTSGEVAVGVRVAAVSAGDVGVLVSVEVCVGASGVSDDTREVAVGVQVLVGGSAVSVGVVLEVGVSRRSSWKFSTLAR